LHEIYADSGHDGPSASGFAAMLAARACDGEDTVFWLRHEQAERATGRLQAAGLTELGIDPARMLFVMAPDAPALLRAAVDVVRCGELGAVVVEAWGTVPMLDLTASRRLMLAAEQSGVTVLLLRVGATPVASAAETRWSVAAAPSTPALANAPGRPALAITLLRRRGGPAGFSAQVEWDRDRRCFAIPTRDAATHAPLHRPAFPLSGDRPGPQRATAA
jgi:protein ImuA